MSKPDPMLWSWPPQLAYKDHDTKPMHACNCIGPRNGQPVCPCRMRGLTKLNGRWVEIVDHGPVAERNDE